MAFGTAGLRGRMGAGYACMNDLVIVQTTQGLAQYLLETVPDAAQRGVVIGYDGRYHSRRSVGGVNIRLAEIVCSVGFDNSRLGQGPGTGIAKFQRRLSPRLRLCSPGYGGTGE